MSLDRESICGFVKFENSEENNKYRVGSMEKYSEFWQSTVLKVVVCSKKESFIAGFSIENQNMEPKL